MNSQCTKQHILQGPSHKGMLQLAKELFSSIAPSDNDTFAFKMNSISYKNFSDKNQFLGDIFLPLSDYIF